DTDRYGRLRYRLRMPGRKTVTIKGQFGSEEFAANYRAAVEGEKSVKRFAGKQRTFNRLPSEYLSSATFAELAPDTSGRGDISPSGFLDGLEHYLLRLLSDATSRRFSPRKNRDRKKLSSRCFGR